MTSVQARTWDALASEAEVARTKTALEANGFTVFVARTGDEARQKALELIPDGSEVFTATSMTNEAIGLVKEINESGRYQALRAKVMALDPVTQAAERRRIASAPDFVTGSVHAITETGVVMIGSGSGSQLPAYVYGAGKVIWVVSTAKIVPTVEDALRRLEEHSLQRESERMQKLRGMNSSLNKILIYRREGVAGRVNIILTQEKLGH